MMKFLKMSFTLKNIYLEHKRNVVDVEILDDLISCHKVFSLKVKIHIEKKIMELRICIILLVKLIDITRPKFQCCCITCNINNLES